MRPLLLDLGSFLPAEGLGRCAGGLPPGLFFLAGGRDGVDCGLLSDPPAAAPAALEAPAEALIVSAPSAPFVALLSSDAEVDGKMLVDFSLHATSSARSAVTTRASARPNAASIASINR